jgi:hypothetical protein
MAHWDLSESLLGHRHNGNVCKSSIGMIGRCPARFLSFCDDLVAPFALSPRLLVLQPTLDRKTI